MRHIAIRTDASLEIGSGHVMRCLALAHALQTAGAECHFICRDHSGNLIEQIRKNGFTVTALQGTVESLSEDWATDAVLTQNAIGGTVVDWLVVDHYAIDARWERALRPFCRKLMVIDDLANRPHDCDLLLDQNLGRNAGDYAQLVPSKCHVLAGTRYALLRPEFTALRQASLDRRSVNPRLENLLIAMGGVDLPDATSKALEALPLCTLPTGLCITVVLSSHAPWIERVRVLAKQMPRLTTVRVDVADMAQLMANSDLAIGAAGSTSWERCCMGLPTLMVVLADNQREGAAALDQCGSAKLIPSLETMRHALPNMFGLLETTDALSQISQNCRQITDGQGVGRVLEMIGECNA
jgi:UDP-2,4-diacetamido-2,4,6-trideoxy-beta-L-altropyranose hydrolase